MGYIPKYNINQCREWAFTKKGKCISTEYVGSKKLEWECEFGHRWQAAFSHIRAGTWCSVCHKQKLKLGIPSIKLTKQQVINRLNRIGFEFIDDNYINTTTKHTLKCSKGHIFNDKSLNSIFSGKVGCSFCNNYFKSENKFRNTIEKIFNKPFPKCRPNWLRNPETNCRLELDCFNEDLKLAFEYDGQFHFEVRKGLNNDLEKTKKLDALKDKLCKQNGINLIRVPYFLKDEPFYELIIDALKIAYKEDYWKIIRNLEKQIIIQPEVSYANSK